MQYFERAWLTIPEFSPPSWAVSDSTISCEDLGKFSPPDGLYPLPVFHEDEQLRHSESVIGEIYVAELLAMFTYYDSLWGWAKEQTLIHLGGTFKPGQLISCDFGVYAPAFKGKHGHTESEVEADLARFWNQLQMPVTPLRDEIDRIARTGMGRILDEVVVLVDSEVLSPREYVVREYAIRQLVGPVYFVELSLRLYLQPGLHHAVVLMSEKDSDCTYYLSFTIEMSDAPVAPVASMLRAAVGAGDYIATSSDTLSRCVGRDCRFVTCCSPFGAVTVHTPPYDADGRTLPGAIRDSEIFVEYHYGGEARPIQNSLPIFYTEAPYSEASCKHVFARNVILFMEHPTSQFYSHYLMELLSSLFDVAMAVDDELPLQQKPLFLIRRISYRNGRSFQANASRPSEAGANKYLDAMPRFHTELWPMLSDHEWVEWEDVLAAAVQPDPKERLKQPSGSICFRRLQVFQDYAMLELHEGAWAPDLVVLRWRMYRESLWAHLRVPRRPSVPSDIRHVLFLRRSARTLLNHDEIAAVLQARNFEVRSLLPDTHSVSEVASAVAQASLLIGINSGAYNAVFLATECGVLELAPLVSPRAELQMHWSVRMLLCAPIIPRGG